MLLREILKRLKAEMLKPTLKTNMKESVLAQAQSLMILLERMLTDH